MPYVSIDQIISFGVGGLVLVLIVAPLMKGLFSEIAKQRELLAILTTNHLSHLQETLREVTIALSRVERVLDRLEMRLKD